MRRLAQRLLLLATSTAVACGHAQGALHFQFDAIDGKEQPQPCMIVINDDWVGAADRQQFVNVAQDDTLSLDLDFSSSQEIEITAVALVVAGGKVEHLPRSRSEARNLSDHWEEVRRLQADDPDRQLFILAQRTH